MVRLLRNNAHVAQIDLPPTYEAADPSILYGDKELYARIAATEFQEGARKKVQDFEIPIRSGKAWTVEPGQICRISTPYGPQVGDLNIWSLKNRHENGAPERLWASRTRQLHATHVSVGDRLWSNLPWMRPLVTIVGDTLSGYGIDAQGGRVHDLLGTRCDPYVNHLLTTSTYTHHCHSNLYRSILPYGLQESDIHDVLNIFQVTGLLDAKYWMGTCPAGPSTSLTFFAETSLLMALSTCPGGDLSKYGWGPDSQREMLETCRPLRVEVFELGVGREGVLRGWVESREVGYEGGHGI